MASAVLDASALIASLVAEPGHEHVDAVLHEAAISTVNLVEVIAYFVKKGESEADIRNTLFGLSVERVPFMEDDAYRTGLLVPATKSAGLSLGDRACLALATRLGVKVLTSDRAWAGIADAAGVTVEVIR